MIRPATKKDFESILALNEDYVHFTCSMGKSELQYLHDQSIYHRVVEMDNRVRAFLLVLPENIDYDSINYMWFSSRLRNFVYVDRIVVAQDYQDKGVGSMLYRDLFDFANKKGVNSITCEIDIEPLNQASQIFHSRFGFREMGTQMVSYGKKRVSLQLAKVAG